MRHREKHSALRFAVFSLLVLTWAVLVPATGPAHAAGAPARKPATASEARPEIAIYAAASLRDVLTELKPALERSTGATAVFNFAASNDLARQIIAADKADVFLSADEGSMDRVAEAGLVEKGTRRPLLSNRLVVIAPNGSALKIADAGDLAKISGKIAMADPEAVPAGKYAKAWLVKTAVWSDSFRGKVLSTADVRAALAAVASGNVDAGIVYRTDAAISRDVRVVYEVPGGEAPKISYPIAVMAHSAHPREARGAAAFLAGAEARAAYVGSGFLVLEPDTNVRE